MKTTTTRRDRSAPVASLLSLALLAAISMPASADSPCRIWNGAAWVEAPAEATDQGNEQGDNNTTCDANASAYGEWNNASGDASSAFGWVNSAYGVASSALVSTIPPAPITAAPSASTARQVDAAAWPCPAGTTSTAMG